MIVVDACAWVRALVDVEVRGDVVRRVLEQDPDWAVPAHTPIEVLRTLRRYEDAGLLSPEQLTEHLDAVAARPVRYVLTDAHLIASTWAWRRRVAMYDAPYVYAAAVLGVPLVTIDRRLARAARSLGVEALVPGDAD